MKKILTIIICMFILAFALIGCGDTSTAEAKVEEYNRFEVIEDATISPSNYSYILVDDETGVCYLFVDGYEACTVTVMLDADGKPLIWSGG